MHYTTNILLYDNFQLMMISNFDNCVFVAQMVNGVSGHYVHYAEVKIKLELGSAMVTHLCGMALIVILQQLIRGLAILNYVSCFFYLLLNQKSDDFRYNLTDTQQRLHLYGIIPSSQCCLCLTWKPKKQCLILNFIFELNYLLANKGTYFGQIPSR